MPRDASATRDALIDAGRELFARDGVYSVALSKVVSRSEQRNESALHYHFGGRRGLLDAIIEVHNDVIEQRRAELLDGLTSSDDGPTLHELVVAYIEPQAAALNSVTGRQFLTIISQLHDLFDRWDDPRAPEEAGRTLHAIAGCLATDLDARWRHERVTRVVGMVAAALGSRSRSVERGEAPALDNAEFTSNLIAMSVGALTAPP